MEPNRDFKIVVAGDVVYDWNLTRGLTDGGGKTARASLQGGGAALLHDLVAEIAAQPLDGRPVSVFPEQGPQPSSPTDERFNHRFTVWSRQPTKEGDEERVWRVEDDLGLQLATGEEAQPALTGVEEEPEEADFVVLNDANHGFRDRREMWPRALRDDRGQRPWVLLRTVRPVAEGPLWERLQPFADRTIAVIRIDDLRLGGMHVTRELSWERTAQDLLSELCGNRQLARCAHVIVSFTTAGAIVLSRPSGGDGKPTCRLVFDPAVMERMWNEQHPGDMIGGVTALTAGVIREVIRAPEDPDMRWGVQSGIKAMRALDLNGYEATGSRPDELSIKYPLARVAGELGEEPRPGERRPFAEAPVSGSSPSHPRLGRILGGGERPWTILEDRHKGNIERLATKVVKEGPARALPEVPRGEFGKLLTFDRNEIEGLQSIRMLIRHYADRERPSRPLSIAVFGPPGAGKSFGVEQVAGVAAGNRVEPLTFNLSQFDDPKGMIDALHQVRDHSLAGKLPLVLWDEFDTSRVTAGGPQKLGWLAHFLAPMQDGQFQDGQLTHPVGPAVFVFAGGVYERMEQFAADAHHFEDAKAPDFVSRLSGYVDVAGPNPRDDVRHDRYYLVRRAVLVHGMLEKHWKEIFHPQGSGEDRVERPDIDEGVLRALLTTKEYRHGSRSVESIIVNSVVHGQDSFGRSDLPSEAQLDLHVDARDFLRIVHETKPPEAAVERRLLYR